MSKIFGIVIIFAAAWLMVRLQAGSGSCCQGSEHSSGSGSEHKQGCCVDKGTSGKLERENLQAKGDTIEQDKQGDH